MVRVELDVQVCEFGHLRDGGCDTDGEGIKERGLRPDPEVHHRRLSQGCVAAVGAVRLVVEVVFQVMRVRGIG